MKFEKSNLGKWKSWTINKNGTNLKRWNWINEGWNKCQEKGNLKMSYVEWCMN